MKRYIEKENFKIILLLNADVEKRDLETVPWVSENIVNA